MEAGDIKIYPDSLPNYAMAVIDERRLVNFALDKAHTIGRVLADNFDNVLGFNKTNWQELAKQIIEKLPEHHAILEREDICSRRFRVDMPIEGVNGKTALVRTIWIFRTDAEHPILDTLKVLL
jgi:hypothetical protein